MAAKKNRTNGTKKMSELEIHSSPIEVQGLASISKNVKESVVTINSRNELRFLVDQYYQAQSYRIAADNQIRSIKQGYDTSDSEEEIPSALEWVSKNLTNQEAQIKSMLDYYTDSVPVGRWLKATIGIGPVIAAGLIAYFDVSKTSHATQFWSYAGLNDNNVPWLGKEKGKKILETALTNCGINPKTIKDKSEIPRQVIVEVSRLSGRGVPFITRNSRNENGVIDKEHLLKHLVMPPYNRNLKVLCYKIGESFVKVSGKPDSLYGELFQEYKESEMEKNANLEFKEQAEAALKEKNYAKSTDAYKYYSKGMLPPAHINARAKRAVVKMFISHLFDAMYIDYYHREPPVPYVIEFKNHTDVILPEVPYEEYIDCNNLLPRKQSTIDHI